MYPQHRLYYISMVHTCSLSSSPIYFNVMYRYSNLDHIRQCCIRTHGKTQPCTMWCVEVWESAAWYLPPVFSWLAALATFSRLLRDFNSGSAIFPLNLGPLVCYFYLLPPCLSYLPLCSLPSSLNILSLSITITQTISVPPNISNPEWMVPLKHMYPHALFHLR